MTNAQAALQASAIFHCGKIMPPEIIENDAARFKTWLDRQDADTQARIKVG